MEFIKKLICLFCILSATSAVANNRLYQSDASMLRKGGSQTRVEAYLSSTISQVDSEGTEITTVDGTTYSLMDFNIDYRYGIMDRFQLLSGIKARYISSGDANTTITSAGLESFYVGAIYGFEKKRGRDFALSAVYRFRPYSVDTGVTTASTGEVILGDGGNDIEFNFLAKYESTKWTSYEMQVGYRLPGAPISSEIPFDFRLIKHYVDWAFWVSANGIYSLGGDEYTDSPSLKPTVSSGNTSRWNSVNRQWLNLDITAQTLIKNKYKLYAMAGTKVMATSTDKDFHGSVGLSWVTGGVSAQKKFEESFKEYTVEANVIKVSPRGVFIKIDHGSLDDIQVGDVVDIYKTDYFGGNILVAQGKVFEVSSNASIVKVISRYRNVPITKGFAARIK